MRAAHQKKPPAGLVIGGPTSRRARKSGQPRLDRTTEELDISVVIPALEEGPNLELLLPQLVQTLNRLSSRWEILIVTNVADEATVAAASKNGATVLTQTERGYGGALLGGFAAARGVYVLTMDADLSHPPIFVTDLWDGRERADVTVASRYVTGGQAIMPRTRYFLSRILNAVFRRGLSIDLHDLSSGFRLYRRDTITNLALRSRDFDVLQEILVRAHAEGRRLAEIPFVYEPRKHGNSHARLFKFGLAYLRTFWALWGLRNSIESADYDDRAHDSIIPLQRYWQRARYRIVTEMVNGEGAALDVGCGSSRIISALPAASVAMDILQRKLRYARKFGKAVCQGSVFSIPFPSQSFSCVVCSQVIEHIPKEPIVLDELCRVMKSNGRLILGTPDYSRWEWLVTEKLYGLFKPGGYADEHISHYTAHELETEMSKRGLRLEQAKYICRGELIMSFRNRG